MKIAKLRCEYCGFETTKEFPIDATGDEQCPQCGWWNCLQIYDFEEIRTTPFKVTEFEGFLKEESTYECYSFCLSRLTEKELYKKLEDLKSEGISDEEISEFENNNDLYPYNFFPEECSNGKWKFKITVEAEKV